MTMKKSHSTFHWNTHALSNPLHISRKSHKENMLTGRMQNRLKIHYFFTELLGLVATRNPGTCDFVSCFAAHNRP